MNEHPAGGPTAGVPTGPPGMSDLTSFDHVRPDDGEHVGYLGMTTDGLFVPFDRLHRRRGPASELDEAETLLEELGLGYLAESWWLEVDGEQVAVRIVELRRDVVVVARAMEDMTAHVAKALDLTRTIELALPTDRLTPA
ncbi:serine/threonine protein phosphatase [Georgenia sp. Z1344]|uniref:serine/threonine protein phosphatase n=1 Tax=Georgenia sp. Z1344 TaxID=3416706 RepID=UPI003CF898AC